MLGAGSISTIQQDPKRVDVLLGLVRPAAVWHTKVKSVRFTNLAAFHSQLLVKDIKGT